jgi:hypothetical protein
LTTMRRSIAVVVVALAASFLTGGAVGATPLVPKTAQAQIAHKAPALAFAPTRIATGFRFAGWTKPGVVRERFANKAGVEIVFIASPLRGACDTGKVKTFQLAGNKVYWGQTANDQRAWRCVRGTGGKMVRLAAATAQPPSKFADVGLGTIVASAKRIAA